MSMIYHRFRMILLSLALAGLGYAGSLSTTAPRDVGMSPEELERASTAVQDLVDREKVAGASVLVAGQGQVVFFETSGMMDREAGKPMEEDTIFRFYFKDRWLLAECRAKAYNSSTA